MGTIVMDTILFMLTLMSVCVLLCAIAFSLKEIKECIKCKKLTSTIISIFILLTQCFATIIVIKAFIRHILN